MGRDKGMRGAVVVVTELAVCFFHPSINKKRNKKRGPGRRGWLIRHYRFHGGSLFGWLSTFRQIVLDLATPPPPPHPIMYFSAFFVGLYIVIPVFSFTYYLSNLLPSLQHFLATVSLPNDILNKHTQDTFLSINIDSYKLCGVLSWQVV